MSSATLYLEKSEIWRFPLERTLIKQLMVNPDLKPTYNFKSYRWELNGKDITYHSQKVYSKLSALIIHIFHSIVCCLVPRYQKKYKAAKESLKEALKIALKEENSKNNRKGRQMLTTQRVVERTIKKGKIEITQKEELIKQLEEKFRIKEMEYQKLKAKKSLEIEGIMDQLNDPYLAEIQIQLLQLSKKNKEIELEKIETEFNALKSKLHQEIKYYSDIIQRQKAKEKKIATSPLGKKIFSQPQGSPSLVRNIIKDFEEAHLANPVKNNTQLNPHSNAFLNLINTHLGPLAEKPWRALLQRFTNEFGHDKMILFDKFEEKKNQKYFCKFSEPLQMWLHSENDQGEAYPKGGVVQKWADNPERKLIFTISKDGIVFEKGYECYIKVPQEIYDRFSWVFVPEFVMSTLSTFKPVEPFDRGFFSFYAYFKFSWLGEAKTKHFEQIENNWAGNTFPPSEVIPYGINHQEVLKSHLS